MTIENRSIVYSVKEYIMPNGKNVPENVPPRVGILYLMGGDSGNQILVGTESPVRGCDIQYSKEKTQALYELLCEAKKNNYF